MASTTSVDVTPDELGAGVAGLVGRKVLEVTNEPASGSMLYLGQWLRRAESIPKERLSAQLRDSRGSDSVFIECPWLLDCPADLGLVVDETDRRSRMLSRMNLLRALIEQRIARAEFAASELSLTLRFEPLGATLRLEPALKGGDLDEYWVQIAETYWSVRRDGRVFRESPAAGGLDVDPVVVDGPGGA